MATEGRADAVGDGAANREGATATRGPADEPASEFERGVLVGLLIGEGHFGGDGRQPHVVLRMHTDHEPLFRWIMRTFPGGRLYGPYHHGGRSYFQWMARGAFLRDTIVPILDEHLSDAIDAKAASRYREMKSRYSRRLSEAPPRGGKP